MPLIVHVLSVSKQLYMVLMSFLSSVLEPYLVWSNPGHPSPPNALGGIVGLTVDRCITPGNECSTP